MHFLKKIITGLALGATTLPISIYAHIIMATPPPVGNPDNSPLTGSNFTCKVTGDPAIFYIGVTTKMAIGETQKLKFKGSAVHGGGSCQLAVTDDLQPSANTVWQVIQSIEGGCPSKDGSSVSEYDFVIPEGITPGKKMFSWDWSSKLAGQPELYMNCALIEVTERSKKRSDNDTMDILPRADFPNLALYNLANLNHCKAVAGTDATFAEPGAYVIRPNPNAKYADIVGTNCFPGGNDTEAWLSGGSTDSGAGSSAVSSASATPETSATPSSAVASSSADDTASSLCSASDVTPSGFLASTVALATSQSAYTTSVVSESSFSSRETVEVTSAAAASTTSGSASSTGSSGPEYTTSSGSLFGPCSTE